RELVVPLQFAVIRVQRNERRRVEVVARSSIAVPVRIRIARAPVEKIEIRIVRTGYPRWRAAAFEHILWPRFAAGFTFCGSGPETPHAVAIGRIVGVEESRIRVFASCDTHNQLALHYKRRHGARVAEFVVSKLDVPD